MRYRFLILTFLISLTSFGQGIVNSGASIVLKNSVNVVITTNDGNYLSKGNGLIYSRNGSTFKLRGDWINNGTTQAIGSNDGVVVLDGDTQYIMGSALTAFDSLQLRGTGEKYLQVDMLVGGGQASSARNGVFDLGDRPFHMEAQKVVVNNPDQNAIQTSGGQLLGETNASVGYSTVQWNVRNTSSASYRIPFGSFDRIDIPYTIDLSSAGAQVADSGFLSVSMYPTSPATAPNNRPLPTGVANLYNDYKLENDIKSVDRFYIVETGGFSSQPVTSMNFPFIDREWDASGGSTNDIVEVDLTPAVYRIGAGQWDYTLTGSTNTGGNVTTSQSLGDPRGIWVLQNVPPCPVAHFTFRDDCIDFGIRSLDSSYVESGYIDSTVWFTDGIETIDQSSIHHFYSSYGNYPIKRKVRSDRGCWDSVEYTAMVFPMPAADFSYTDTCFGDLTTFVSHASSPTGNPVTHTWLVEGNSSSNQTIYHTYADTGLKPVRLIAENSWGCADTTEQYIEIQPLPNISFHFDSICEGHTADFINTTTSKGIITEQRWSVNDLLASFSQDYSQKFNLQGGYDIQLYAQNSFGCEDSLTQGLVVKPRAVANFSIFPEEIFITEPHVNLVETTSFANSWEWELGDMSGTQYGTDVFHTYADTGLYSIRLIANNDQNCADTIYKVIRIKPYLKIYIPNAFRPDGDPMNVNATFKPAGMLYGLKEMTMEIYNRWGEQLYFTDDINKPWDGTYQGRPVKEGTYLYMIKIKDIYNQIAWHQGTVTLVR